MTGQDWKTVLVLLGAMVITIFPHIAYYQLSNVLPVWLEEHGNMNAGGFRVPIPWFQSIDPLFSILCVPLLFRLWQWQGSGAGEPSELRKIGAGAFICGAANLILVAAIVAYGSNRVLWIWPFLFCAIQGVGFMYFWPPFLSLMSRASPPAINATMMGGAFLVLFVANNLIGWIGTFYEQLGPATFWGLHAAIGGAGGVFAFIYSRTAGRLLEPEQVPASTR
jgi:POT family proton-dependent oligopeptide transporter